VPPRCSLSWRSCAPWSVPDGGVWSGRKVALWITGRIGRTVSPQRGVEDLRRLDVTRQVPANPKASLSEQARFKKSSRPASPSFKAPNARSKFGRYRLGLKPIRSGRRAVAAPGATTATSGSISMASSHRRARVVHRRWPALFSALLASFATEIGAGPNKHIILVLDGAGWHVSKDLEVPEGVELMFLPPYSPQIQPAERF
jgi:hypothetical protein